MPARNPRKHALWFGLLPFRSPLLWESIFLSPPPGTEMFQFPGFPPHTLCFRVWVTSLQLAGFPHSDIKGSMPACGSPLLFAACHVLLRRLVPWHPPCALLRLITLLRRRYNFLRSIDFLNLQLVFQDFSRLLLCAVVKVRGEFLHLPRKILGGGSQWTRTTDLSLIRRVL